MEEDLDQVMRLASIHVAVGYLLSGSIQLYNNGPPLRKVGSQAGFLDPNKPGGGGKSIPWT